MEDSFRVRLDRAFGSLNPCSSTPASSSLTSLWCLTDEEIERRNSNKSKDDLDHTDGKTDQTPPLLSEKEDLVADDIEDLNDFVDEDELNDSDDEAGKILVKPDDHNEEEWDIRSSIGLDCTLDYEEEEDEYDKVAVGKESNTVEEEEKRLYLKDKNDYEVDMDYHDELPDTFKENIQRDPRANHTAAKLRLKEDAESSGYFDSLQTPTPTPALNLKSILKRKENQSQNRSDKRVRFHLQDGIKEELETTTTTPTPVESSDLRVPDYVRNPSRYTHYTFDDSVSEMDEESNKKAHLEFLNQLRTMPTITTNSPTTTTTTTIDPLPKSVIFSSRKKQKESQSSEDEEGRSKESCKRNRVAIGIAAKGLLESEVNDGVCAMEEDEPETVGVGIGVSNLKRQARQYRAKEIVE